MSKSGTIEIIVTQTDSGSRFYPVLERVKPLQKIKHCNVLHDFPAEPLKPQKVDGKVIAWRYGYTLPPDAVKALTDDDAYRAWNNALYASQMRSLNNQMYPGNNGNNSFIRHQKRQLQPIHCPHCGEGMKAVTLITVGGKMSAYTCPGCKATFQKTIMEEKTL